MNNINPNNAVEVVYWLFSNIPKQLYNSLRYSLPLRATPAREVFKNDIKKIAQTYPQILDVLFGNCKARWVFSEVLTQTFIDYLWHINIDIDIDEDVIKGDLWARFVQIKEWHENHGIVLDNSSLLKCERESAK